MLFGLTAGSEKGVLTCRESTGLSEIDDVKPAQQVVEKLAFPPPLEVTESPLSIEKCGIDHIGQIWAVDTVYLLVSNGFVH